MCIICGDWATHHHKYCNKHYPQKSATILQLKSLLKDKQKEIRKLENKILQLKNKDNNNCNKCHKLKSIRLELKRAREK
jgi:hypothetical protein